MIRQENNSPALMGFTIGLAALCAARPDPALCCSPWMDGGSPAEMSPPGQRGVYTGNHP